jgi:hypothetical protein
MRWTAKELGGQIDDLTRRQVQPDCLSGIDVVRVTTGRARTWNPPNTRVIPLGTLALSPLLRADLATYVFSGTASGSVGTQAFSDATLSVTGIADTNNIVVNPLGFGFDEIDFAPGAAALTISGAGAGTFTNLVFIVRRSCS